MRNVDLLRTRESKKKTKYSLNHSMTCYALLALPLIGFFVFTLYPMIWAFIKSAYSYTGIPSETRFVGWDNFKTLFNDEYYWKSWIMTFEYALVKIPLEAVLAFITAYFLTKEIRGTNFFRSLYYLPGIFSVAIIGLVFSNLFDFWGIVNGLLVKFGIIEENIDWLANKGTAFTALLVGGIWNSFGTTVLYFMAAMANVPKDLYESADLDGCGEFGKMVRITLPMIAPVLQVLMLLSINGCLHVGEYILVMTGGAPAGSTHSVLSYQISRIVPGFGELANIGYGSAMSVVTSFIFCVIALGYNKLSDKLKNLY